MPHHDYLIVGGGMAADAAVRGIRELDARGSVGVVSSDADPPYDRPPLSKALWSGDRDEAAILRGTGELGGVHVSLGRRITRIDPDDHTATDDRGVIYTWRRLLLATGGTPRKLKGAPPQVIHYRTLADYRTVRKLVDRGASFVVAGGGFVGSEMAASLAAAGRKVSMLFPEDGILGRVLPERLSARVTERFRERGVDVRPGTGVASVRRTASRMDEDTFLVATEPVEGGASDTLRVQGVVAGLGIVPNDQLAATAGIEVVDAEEGGGIVVDPRMATNKEDVYAAGDVAAVWCAPLGTRIRFEHEDQANATGHRAGRAMAGDEEPWEHLPFFYSDLFDDGYEAVGLLDPSGSIVEDWAEELERGVVYYLEGGRVRGVLLWNVRGKLKAARELVRAGGSRSAASLRGAIDLG